MGRSRSSFFLALIFCAGSALAQPSEIELSEINRSINADFYYLLYRETVSIEIVKGAVVSTTNTNKIFYYNDYKNTGYSNFNIVYNSAFSEIKNLNAASYVLEKGKYKKHSVSDFSVSKYSDSNMFEDAYEEITFTMPAVNKGTIGQIQYDDVNSEPHFASSFYFKQFIPIARNEFIVEVDKNIEIAYKYLGDSSVIAFEKTSKGSKVIYKWTSKSIETLKREDYMPKLNKLTSQVVCWTKSANINGKKTLINNDITSFNCWIYGLCKNVFNSPLSDAAKKYVDSLKLQQLSEPVLGRKIFEHVQKNIKYIAFENGLHGYIPRKPADVYHKRFGDCKDKATLLSAMLNYAGIESKTALVGTTALIYKFSELPIPECANHMITAVKVNGTWTITDATDEYVSYLSVPQSLQGKEALILIDSAVNVIYTIPELPYYKNGRIDSLEISIKGLEVSGKGRTFLIGYMKENVLANLESLSEEKQKEYYKEYIDLGSNKCEYVNLTREVINDTTLAISYDFILPSYITQYENKLYLNPHFFKTGIDDLGIDSSKQHPVQFKFLSFNKSVLKVSMEGMSLDHLPPNSSHKRDGYGYSIEYKDTGNQVIISSSYYENTMMLMPSDFVDYEKYFTSFRKANLDNISFNKK